jgi:hypothetical protein
LDRRLGGHQNRSGDYWSMVFLENIIVYLLMKDFADFLEPENSLQCSSPKALS